MNAIKNETLTDTVTLQLGHAVELLEGAMSHAHPKSDLPILNTVKINGGEGELKATATDRYRLIEGTVEAEGNLTDTIILLSDIKRVLSLLKGEGKRMESLPVTISRTGDMVSVSVRGNAITLNAMQATYPDTVKFLEDASEPVAVRELAFNPAFMSDYAKIASRGSKSPVAVRLVVTGDRKPIKVIFTENSARKVEWRAILMPMRVA